MKTTKWFPGTVKPVRAGVYQRRARTGTSTSYSYWDQQWHLISRNPRVAACNSEVSSIFQTELEWRGLAQEPKP